jgi:hypothetical protein
MCVRARVPRLLGLLFTCLLAGAATAATATASWPTAPPLSNPLTSDSSAPAIAVAPDGAALAVWREVSVNSIEYAARPAGGSFGTRLTLEGSGASTAESKPAVALDSAGAAVVAWTFEAAGAAVVKASYREPGKAFSTPLTISPAGKEATDPAVAISSDGKAIVVWGVANAFGESFAEASVHGPTGAFSAGQLLNRVEDTGTNLPLKARVAMDGAGNAIAAFPSERPGGLGVLAPLQWSYMPAASTAFGAPGDLESSTFEAGNTPDLAFAADGRATVVWQTTEGVIKAAEESAGAGAAFGSAKVISVSGDGSASKPGVGVDGPGNATVVFQARPSGGDSAVKVTTRPAGGSFSTPATLSSPGDSGDAQIAVDAAGDAAAAWTRAPAGKAQTVEASYRPVGGSFEAPATTLAGNTGSASPGHLPAVAMDAAGSPTAVWRSTQSFGVIWASTYSAGSTPPPGEEGEGGGGGGSTPAALVAPAAPVAAAATPPAPQSPRAAKPLKCRKGFRKKAVRGKPKCVKVAKPKKR